MECADSTEVPWQRLLVWSEWMGFIRQMNIQGGAWALFARLKVRHLISPSPYRRYAIAERLTI